MANVEQINLAEQREGTRSFAASHGQELHALWVCLGPRIELAARIASRGWEAERRAEFVQECAALGWQWTVRLVERGRNPLCFARSFTMLLIRAVGCGRRLVGMASLRDLWTRLESRESASQFIGTALEGFQAEQGTDWLPRGQRHRDEWESQLGEHDRAEPGDQAAFRMDFRAWLKTLDRRRRRIALALSRGERTADVAARFGISPSRVSQLRWELLQDWKRFLGEAG